MARRDLELPSNSGRYAGSGAQVDEGLYLEATEHDDSVHHHQANRVHLPGGGETPGVKGSKAVVVSSGDVYCRRVGG